MATVDATGITPTPLEGMTDAVEAVLRDALGQDLDFEPETTQGQVALAEGAALTQCDELVSHVSNGFGVYTAVGLQQDRLFGALGVRRIAGTRSTVTATLSGTANTQVPAGSRARTTGGALFETNGDTVIGSGGTVDVLMRSVSLGPVTALAATLTGIVTVTSGWAGITNAAAATPGTLEETDRAYRRRYLQSRAANAGDSVEAIVARLLRVENVARSKVLENQTSAAVTTQGLSVGAYSVMGIVEGGVDADVALGLYLAKGSAGTSGAVSVDVTRRGLTEAVLFQRVTLQPLAVAVTIDILPGFPGDGVNQLRQRVVDWVAGEWNSGAGDFDTEGLPIGELIDVNRIYSPINSVPGHRVTALSVTLQAGGTLPTSINGNIRQTLAYADCTVSVN